MTANRKHGASSAPLTDPQGEVRELIAADFAHQRPTEGFPELVEILQSHGKLGRPPLPASERKQRVTLHLDPDVLSALKAEGRGWQTRANAALRKALNLPPT